jgi:Prokaryotic N-terminal methylation motif
LNSPFCRHPYRAFTLLELLVSIGLLVVLVLLVSRVFTMAMNTVRQGQMRIDADAQVRPLFDRMAIDFAQMLKRSDVDFYGKGTSAGGAMTGASLLNINDKIGFYSSVPGDYSSGSASPISVIAYKVNSSTAAGNKDVYTRLQRMARGLLMNGDSSDVKDGPLIFGPAPTISQVWTTVASNAQTDSRYEVACAQVFRFEYYYLLTNGSFSATPWTGAAGHTSINGLQDVAAIIVAVAAIDQTSRILLSSDNSQVATIATKLPDYSAGTMAAPGQLIAQWQNKLSTDATIKAMPRPAINGIRLYERAFYLTPTQQ